MAACSHYRVSLDEWHGWSDYAQSAALAYMSWEADTCNQGHERALWDPDAGGDMTERVQVGQRTCPACAVLEQSQESFDQRRTPGTYRVFLPLEQRGHEHPDHGQPDDQGEEGQPDHAGAEQEAP